MDKDTMVNQSEINKPRDQCEGSLAPNAENEEGYFTFELTSEAESLIYTFKEFLDVFELVEHFKRFALAAGFSPNSVAEAFRGEDTSPEFSGVFGVPLGGYSIPPPPYGSSDYCPEDAKGCDRNCYDTCQRMTERIAEEDAKHWARIQAIHKDAPDSDVDPQ